MKRFIEKINNKEDLSFEESKAAFKLLMEGKVNEQDIFDFLTFLSQKARPQMKLQVVFTFSEKNPKELMLIIVLILVELVVMA